MGSDTAYVGFSAADGSGASTQFISNFTFESASSSSPVDTWTNHTGDGEWITSGNWSGGGAPGPDELALINSGGTPEIAFDVTLDGVALVNYGAIGLTNSGTTLTLDDGAIINGEATGTLTINQHNAVDVEAGHDGGSALFDGLNVYDYGSLDVGDQNPNAVRRSMMAAPFTVAAPVRSSSTPAARSMPSRTTHKIRRSTPSP